MSVIFSGPNNSWLPGERFITVRMMSTLHVLLMLTDDAEESVGADCSGAMSAITHTAKTLWGDRLLIPRNSLQRYNEPILHLGVRFNINAN